MIKVFRAKDLIKYSITVTVPLLVIMVATNATFNSEKPKKLLETSSKSVTEHIYDGVELLKNSKQEDNAEKHDYIKEWGKIILDSEYGILNATEEKEETINKAEVNHEEQQPQEQESKPEEITQAPTDVKTEVIDSGVNPKVTQEYNGVKINNSSNHELTEADLNPEGISVNKKKVFIYHTHTCESYTPTEKYYYESTGNYRTTDLGYSVARVGDELESQLTSYGCQVIHDKTYHDYPSYNGSYSRSLNTAEKILSENKDIDISIDLHRDAIGDESYAPKVKIGDEYVSQLMFVIGTDGSNPNHTNWNQNLKFAIDIQTKANEMYPGLFKPIIVRNSAYNQQISKGACIIEVGATGNTLEESIGAMKYLAKIIDK